MFLPRYLTEKNLRVTPQKSLPAYVSFHFRTSTLIFLIPWAVLVSLSDLLESSLLPDLFRDPENRQFITMALVDVMLVLVFTISPVFLRFIWRTRPLPDCSLRRRLQDLASRLGFSCRDILIWDTQGTGLVNAAVAGILPLFRYVFITDTLLASMSEDEVLGVFAHEIAHAKLGHLRFFLVFLVAFSFLPDSLTIPLANLFLSLHFPPAYAEWASLLVLFGGYWGILFGFISRRFERQADLVGADSTSVDSFTHALERLSVLNGIPRETPSWRHFSIARRVDFLRKTQLNPAAVRGLERTLRLALVSFLLIAFAAVFFALLTNFTDII